MAEERVDRARKMVRRIRFSFHFRPNHRPSVVETIYRSTPCTANPSFSSISTDHISPLCAFSTNARYHYRRYKASEFADPLGHLQIRSSFRMFV